MARVYETSVVLILLAILVTSIVWVGMALIDRGRSSDEGTVVVNYKQSILYCNVDPEICIKRRNSRKMGNWAPIENIL